MISRMIRRMAMPLSLAVALVTFAVAPGAMADYQHIGSKPEYKLADDNNVDLLSGQFSLSTSDLSIGSGDGALPHVIQGEGNILWPNSHDNYFTQIQVYGSISTYLVPGGDSCAAQLASVLVLAQDSSERFCVKNGAFVSWANRGGTLVLAGTVYTYTTKDGVEYQFTSPTQVRIKYPGGVIKNIYYNSGGQPISVTSSTGYQLHYDYDSASNLSSVTAFNSSVEYCTPTAATCAFTHTWPNTHYTITGTAGGTDSGVGYVIYDITLQDQYGRTTNAHRAPGILTVTTPESSISGNFTWTLCDYSGTISSFTTSCNANMGPGVPNFQKLGHVVSSTRNGALTTYNWLLGGVPYTAYGTSTGPTGKGRGRSSVPNCGGGWDPCFSGLLLEDGTDITYDYLHRSQLAFVTYDSNIKDTFTFDDRDNLTQTVRTPKAGSSYSPITVSSNYEAPTCSNIVICNKPTYTLDAKGNETDYTYDPVHGGVLTVTTPPATTGGPRAKTRNVYTLMYPQVKNAAGTLISSTPVYMLTETSTCDSTQATCTGATDTRTVYTYVSNNLLMTAKTVYAANVTVGSTCTTTNLCQQTTYTYDDVGNLTSEDGPLDDVVDKTVYRYNSLNQKIGVVGPDPDGSGILPRQASRTTYNTAGQVILVENGTMTGQAESDWVNFHLVNQTETAYDSYGRVALVRSKANGVYFAATETSYDSVGRVSCTAVRMNPTTFNSLLVTDDACTLTTPDGAFGPDRITKNTYDALNHVTKVERAYGTSLQQAYATYTFTDLGLKLTEADAKGNTTHFVYDDFDRLWKTQYPNTSTITCGGVAGPDQDIFLYDVNGNRTSWQRRNCAIIGYTYDNLNRETKQDLPVFAGNTDGSSHDVYSDYDIENRVLHKRFGSATSATNVSYIYDGLNRVKSTTDMNGRQLQYSYNMASARATMTYPDSKAVNFDRDNLNRLIVAHLSSDNSILYSQTFDGMGRRLKLIRAAGQNSGACAAKETCFTYDDPGHLTSMTDRFNVVGTSVTWTFNQYNPAGQAMNWSATNAMYDYQVNTSSTDTRTYDSLNRDATIAGMTGGYDKAGNLTGDGTRTMTYDIYNRLLTTTSATANLKLDYDPEGRLANYSADGGTTWTQFVYDRNNLLVEYDNSGTMTERYLFGERIDEPVIWFHGATTGTLRYFFTNYQGSVIARGSAGGVMSEAMRYSAYGEPEDSTGAVNWTGLSRFRYTGQIGLPEAQLYYYKARVYDPALAHFLQTDTIGSKDNLDLYAYTAGDPINNTDPAGTETINPEKVWDIAKGVTDLIGVILGNPSDPQTVEDAAPEPVPVEAPQAPQAPKGSSTPGGNPIPQPGDKPPAVVVPRPAPTPHPPTEPVKQPEEPNAGNGDNTGKVMAGAGLVGLGIICAVAEPCGAAVVTTLTVGGTLVAVSQ